MVDKAQRTTKNILSTKEEQKQLDNYQIPSTANIFESSNSDNFSCKEPIVIRNSTAIYQSHDKDTITIAISDDESMLATVEAHGAIKIWDDNAQYCLARLIGHAPYINSIQFSPDNRYLISGSDDCTIKIWNLALYECLCTLQGHPDGVSSISYIANGTQIISASLDGTIKIWNSRTHKCERTLSIKNLDEIEQIIPMLDESKILIKSREQDCLLLYNIENFSTKKIYFEEKECTLDAMCLSVGKKKLAAGLSNYSIQIYDAESLQVVHIIKKHTLKITWLVFMRKNDHFLVSASADKSIVISNQGVIEYEMKNNFGQAVYIMPFKKTLIIQTQCQRASLFDIPRRQVTGFRGHENTIQQVVVSRNLQWIASHDNDYVLLWDVKTKTIKQTYYDSMSKVQSIIFSPDSQHLFIFQGKLTPLIINLSEKVDECKYIGNKIAFSKVDGKVALFNTADQSLKLKKSPEAPFVEVEGFDFQLNEFLATLEFSSDGKKLLFISEQSIIYLNTENLKILSKAKNPDINGIGCFIEHDRKILTLKGENRFQAGLNNILKIWSAKDMTCIASRQLGNCRFSQIKALGEKNMFLISGQKSRVQVWKTNSYRFIREIKEEVAKEIQSIDVQGNLIVSADKYAINISEFSLDKN